MFVNKIILLCTLFSALLCSLFVQNYTVDTSTVAEISQFHIERNARNSLGVNYDTNPASTLLVYNAITGMFSQSTSITYGANAIATFVSVANNIYTQLGTTFRVDALTFPTLTPIDI